MPGIVRVRFDPQGNPLGFEDFVSGSLLVTDDAHGVIYRVSYSGG